MKIDKRISLNNNIFYVVVDVEYKFDGNITRLCLKNYKDDYYDSGDLTALIEKIEKSYSNDKALKYDNKIGFMADVLYIYDRIPFLTGIKDVYINSKDNIMNSICYISKEEIENYIEEHNIKIETNTEFKLFNEETWKI